jgi:transcriptional regulator with XRE-family HTH domain
LSTFLLRISVIYQHIYCVDDPVDVRMFWNRVKSELKKLGKTQEQLSEAIGVKYDTLTNWITRGIWPKIGPACHIAKYLGVTVEFLYDGSQVRISGYDKKISERPAIKNIVDSLLPFKDYDVQRLIPVIEQFYINRDFAEIKRSIG